MVSPDGTQLILLVAGRLYHYRPSPEKITLFSDPALVVLEATPDPYWRYAYVIEQNSDGLTYGVGVMDISPLSQRLGKRVALLRTGTAGLRLALDAQAARLAIADANDAAPRRLSYYDIADPEAPLAQTPAIGVPALARLAFSPDGTSLYGVDAAGQVTRFTPDEATSGSPLPAQESDAPNALAVSTDGARLWTLGAKGIRATSLGWPAPLAQAIGPLPLQRGTELTLTLANDVCAGRTGFSLVPANGAPLPLLTTSEPRQFKALVPAGLVSGDFIVRCEGRPDSLPLPYLVGRTHRYGGFQSTYAVDGLHVSVASDVVTAVLRNANPGEIGFLRFADQTFSDLSVLGLAAGMSRSLLASQENAGLLYGLGLSKGLFVGRYRDAHDFARRVAEPAEPGRLGAKPR